MAQQRRQPAASIGQTLPAALLAMLAAALGSGAHAEQSAAQWLDRMSLAMQTLNYEGTFVYVHGGGEIETMRIVHSRDDSGERERLLSLNGEAREVIRDDRSVTCIWPDSRSVTVSKARPRTPLPTTIPEAARLRDRYAFRLIEGDARIAGLKARIIAIEPRDEFRYGYRLWLDRETDLLLRSDLIDEQGRALEQVMFTDLRVLEQIPAERFKPVLTGTGYTWLREDEDPEMAPDPMWKVTRLPPGFDLKRRSKRPMAETGRGVEHFVYTDGLASVSVFIEPLGERQQRMEGTSSMGAVNVFGTVNRDYQITVVGEVPAATVEYIAQAVVYNP